jgi:hypothetical protein
MKINIGKSIELEKKLDSKKQKCYNNCIKMFFNQETKKIQYAEGIYKAQYGWMDHAWLIIDDKIVDVTFTQWHKVIPVYRPCIIYSGKEVSELLIRANGILPLYYVSPELMNKYVTKKERILKQES